MSDSLPIACTLGPQDGLARRERWKRLAQRADPHSIREADAIVVSFCAGPGIHEELAALAEAEADCCSFLTWDVTVDRGLPTLTITSPTGDRAALNSVAALWTAI